MNPTTDEHLPPPPQPHRNSISCDRHPDEQFSGFCPSCLCERLSVLDQSANTAASSSSAARKSASSALKSLFKPSHDSGAALRGRPSSSSFFPELRRTKSFSGGKNEGGFLGFSGAFEPQRRSCDVRGRSTLFSLFSQDNEKRSGGSHAPHHPSNNDAVLRDPTVVIESKEEQANHVGVEEIVEEEEEEQFHDSNDNGDEIQVVSEEHSSNLKNPLLLSSSGEQIVEEIKEEKPDLKTMKDHMDLDSHNKKPGTKDLKELAGSLWSAASVFSKKLKAWTRKHNNQKMKKRNASHTVQVSSKKGHAGRNYRDTQSEIADYGYGRRSCDTDPRLSFDVGRFSVDAGRFSVDTGRISLDDPRCSFDEPRASWDGYLIGRTAFPRMIPPMVSVVEDAPVTVSRKDTQIPVEEPRRSSVSINGEDCVPGGVVQTKDYYSDSSSRRRKSLDRSNSIRKTAATVVAEMDEMKNHNNVNGCNPKHISPASLAGERDSGELKDLNMNLNLNSNSYRDDCSESFDLGFRGNAASVIGNADRKGLKKSRRWRAWNIWGLIYRRGNAKDEDNDDGYSRENGVERSFSESWPELRREGYGDPRAGFNPNVFRSNSSVSWRNAYNVGGSFGSTKKGSMKKRDEFVLERNRSARYSPNSHADKGLLRFYLTPLRGSQRGASGKPNPAYSHSLARSVMRFY